MAIELTVLSMVDSLRTTKGDRSVASAPSNFERPLRECGFFNLRTRGESMRSRPKAAEGDRLGDRAERIEEWGVAVLSPPPFRAPILEADEPMELRSCLPVWIRDKTVFYLRRKRIRFS